LKHSFELWRLAQSFGATCHQSTNPSITHVISSRSDTEKVRFALQNKIKIKLVRPEWLIRSCNEWNKFDESLFGFSKEELSSWDRYLNKSTIKNQESNLIERVSTPNLLVQSKVDVDDEQIKKGLEAGHDEVAEFMEEFGDTSEEEEVGGPEDDEDEVDLDRMDVSPRFSRKRSHETGGDSPLIENKKVKLGNETSRPPTPSTPGDIHGDSDWDNLLAGLSEEEER